MLPEATNVAGPAGGSGFLPPQAKIAVDFLLTYVRNPVFCDFGASYRPWREFLSVNKFSKPGPGEWAGRMTTNVGAFKGNYAALFVFFLIYSIVTNPMLLISVGLPLVFPFPSDPRNQIVLVGSGWAGDASLKGRPVNLFGREVTNNERKLGLVILTFLVFLLS